MTGHDMNPLWTFRCQCGHHMDAHHATPKGRYTWCSVFSPLQCPCTEYRPEEDTA